MGMLVPEDGNYHYYGGQQDKKVSQTWSSEISKNSENGDERGTERKLNSRPVFSVGALGS